MIRHLFSLLALGSVLLFSTACTTEDYESGNGENSFLRADFVEARSGEAKRVNYAITDEGDSLVFRGGASCEWTTTPDSVYRALLYSARDNETAPYTRFVSMSQVLVLPIPQKKREKVCVDPLTMESAWMSANGRYLNLGLYVKTGVEGDSVVAKHQLLGVNCDTTVVHDDGSRELHLVLYHDQAGVPEYYSSCVYASIPISPLRKGDVVHLDVHTYNGLVSRSFVK
jgi:hypothetical protein